jgi:hypothetical protein
MKTPENILAEVQGEVDNSFELDLWELIEEAELTPEEKEYAHECFGVYASVVDEGKLAKA